MKKIINSGEMFCCRDVSSWCLNWLESKNFICGLLFRDDYERTDFVTTGFHWAVILPILDDNGSLDIWVIELSRWKPDGYTLTKILFDWRTFVNRWSWRNFVVFRDSDLIGTVKENNSKIKAMLASSWVWNIVKDLERKKILGAKRWLLDETRKINEWLSLDKMNFGIWPCIVPFNKKIHDNPGKIGETVNSVLEIPDIKASIFSAHHLPEFKEFEEVSFALFYKKITYLLKEKNRADCRENEPFLMDLKFDKFVSTENLAIKSCRNWLLKQLENYYFEEYERNFVDYEEHNGEMDDERIKIKEQIEELENKVLPEKFCESVDGDKFKSNNILYFEILLPKDTPKRSVTPQKILPKKDKLIHFMNH